MNTPFPLSNQMPRLSKYDPGAIGEGGLDPIGLAAVANRIADVLAPGVRARMNRPHFVTISAIGSIAYKSLLGKTATDGKTTVDIAFEWLVVESLVRYGNRDGLPGNQKARYALQNGKRLSIGTYLSGPRTFGFTGVYRPLSRDISVLFPDDRPAENALQLGSAWEQDHQLSGYVDGKPNSVGGKLRQTILNACDMAMEKSWCHLPPGGQLLKELSNILSVDKSQERRVLRKLISSGSTSGHEIRNEIVAKLVAAPPSVDITQRDLIAKLQKESSRLTSTALMAAFDYEEAATALDNGFRRFVAYTVQTHGTVVSPSNALKTPGFVDLAHKVPRLVERAISSVAKLDHEGLRSDTACVFELFTQQMTPGQLFDALIERHQQVQAIKNKLCWLDQVGGDWIVRPPYRRQTDDLNDSIWTHPMRVKTLANLLVQTE